MVELISTAIIGIRQSSNRLRILLTIRLVAVIPFMIAVSRTTSPVSDAGTALFVVYTTIIIAAVLWVQDAAEAVRRSLVVLDVMVVAALIYFTSGLYSGLYLYSLATILLASLLLEKPWSFAASAAIAAAYLAGSISFLPTANAGFETTLLIEELIGYAFVAILIAPIMASAEIFERAVSKHETGESLEANRSALDQWQGSTKDIGASLGKNEIIDIFFAALAHGIGVTGSFRLGFIDKKDRQIRDWRLASDPEGVETRFAGHEPVSLESSDLVARAVIEKKLKGKAGGDCNMLAVPLVSGGSAVAVLEIIDTSAGALSEEQIRAIIGLCRQTAAALKNASVLRSVRNMVQRLSSLYEVTGQIHSKRVPERIAVLVADYAKKIPHSEKVIVWLTTEKSRIDAKSMIVRGCRRELPEKVWRADFVKLTNRVIRKRRPVVVRRYDFPDRFPGAGPTPVFVLGVPLMAKDKVSGVLIAMTTRPRRFGKEDITTLSILGQMAGRAIENAALYQTTKKLAAFEERYRIAMDLHDGLAQALFSIALNLEVCQRMISSGSAEVATRLSGLQALTTETLKETRRYILELQPDSVMADSLQGIVKDYIRKFNTSSEIKAKVICRGRPTIELPISIKQNFYRILQEALANIVKHAQASQAKVQLTFADHAIELRVEDNGVGLPNEALRSGQVLTSGMGLVNIQKRADIVGGQLSIDSRPGQGTKILVRAPVRNELDEN